jgi:hypothetical protein
LRDDDESLGGNITNPSLAIPRLFFCPERESGIESHVSVVLEPEEDEDEQSGENSFNDGREEILDLPLLVMSVVVEGSSCEKDDDLILLFAHEFEGGIFFSFIRCLEVFGRST